MSKNNAQRRGQTIEENNKTTEAVQNAVESGTATVTTVAAVEPKKVTTKQIMELPADVASLEGKSAKIRKLASMGWQTGDIARTLQIRYQHARNVLKQPLKSTTSATA
jgi:hypothetical protein